MKTYIVDHVASRYSGLNIQYATRVQAAGPSQAASKFMRDFHFSEGHHLAKEYVAVLCPDDGGYHLFFVEYWTEPQTQIKWCRNG